MDIYEKIDAIFSGESEEKPQWARDILDELREIKTLLNEHMQPQIKRATSYNDNDGLYAFIKQFRVSMRADTNKSIYPTFEYQGKNLGVDFKGLLYDKETTRILPRDEAYRVYRYAFDTQKYSKNIA